MAKNEHMGDYIFIKKDTVIKTIKTLVKSIELLSIEATDQDITDAVAKLIKLRQTHVDVLTFKKAKLTRFQ
jgi:hypothetical protein